jgi:hypothetical protein
VIVFIGLVSVVLGKVATPANVVVVGATAPITGKEEVAPVTDVSVEGSELDTVVIELTSGNDVTVPVTEVSAAGTEPAVVVREFTTGNEVTVEVTELSVAGNESAMAPVEFTSGNDASVLVSVFNVAGRVPAVAATKFRTGEVTPLTPVPKFVGSELTVAVSVFTTGSDVAVLMAESSAGNTEAMFPPITVLASLKSAPATGTEELSPVSVLLAMGRTAGKGSVTGARAGVAGTAGTLLTSGTPPEFGTVEALVGGRLRVFTVAGVRAVIRANWSGLATTTSVPFPITRFVGARSFRAML